MESLKPGYHRIPTRCIDRRQCQLHHVCPKERCYRQCNTCYQSNEYRMKFREERCSKLQMTLYVCNGCREENQCTLRKQFYVHDTAEKSYRKMLVCSRSGASIPEAERLFLSERIDQEIQKRQSFHHILASDADQITVGKKTVYRYINAGLLRTKRGDMPRSC